METLIAAISMPWGAAGGWHDERVRQRHPVVEGKPARRMLGSSARNCWTSPACSGPARSRRRYISASGTLASSVFPAALA